MTQSYYVRLTAVDGFLLGGVKTTLSSRFQTRQQAEDYMAQALEANSQAGRKAEGRITPSIKVPQIEAHETGHTV